MRLDRCVTAGEDAVTRRGAFLPMLDLEDIFGPGGPLESALPDFRVRRGQLRMAQRVAAALASGETLTVEAGTGTGKTFAYLVPALLSGARVLISTGTRTLQDQLYSKDLPLVGAALGRPARVALLKGRANYLCRARLGAHGDAGRQLEMLGGGAPRSNRAMLARIALGAYHAQRRSRRGARAFGRAPGVGPGHLDPRDLPRCALCGILPLSRGARTPRGP